MNEVAKPVIKAGDNAKIAYRKTDAALDEANGRLRGSRGWYVGVLNRYGGAKLNPKRKK